MIQGCWRQRISRFIYENLQIHYLYGSLLEIVVSFSSTKLIISGENMVWPPSMTLMKLSSSAPLNGVKPASMNKEI